MRTVAALRREPGAPWAIEEIDVIEPRVGEVRVRLRYAGLCHSDEHLRLDPGAPSPIVGGHEGSGVVEAVGPQVHDLQPGDHVITSFIPVCGRCKYCVNGRSYLCDQGSQIGTGQLLDGAYPFSDGASEFGGFCMLGTFSEQMTVSRSSLIKIEPDIPLDVAALVSCGVATGWGTAVHAAAISVGDVVVIFGAGGIGINAVQGARHAGAGAIIVVDPVEFKRDTARRLGATHVTDNAEEASRLAASLSRGTGADAVLLTPAGLDQAVLMAALSCVGKGGKVLLVALSHDPRGVELVLPTTLLTAYCISVSGVLFGHCNPQYDQPRLLDMWRQGKLELDSLITKRYALDDISSAYRDQEAGLIIRGVVEFPS